MKRRQFVSTLGGAGIATASVAGRANAQTTTTGDPRQGSGTKGDPYVVDMVGTTDYRFTPVGLFVEKDAYVEWVIRTGSHSSTSYSSGNPREQAGDLIPSGAQGWDSGVLTNAGDSFTNQFTVEGTYDYYCIPHKTLGMVGRIVVDEPGGPAEGSMPPDGDVPESGTIVDQGSVSYSEFSG